MRGSRGSNRRGLRLRDGNLTFTFDGRSLQAREGDTLSSALLAHGVRLMGRSVKARHLRGVLTAGPEEPNALVTVGTAPALLPNVPATQLVLRNGLATFSQNRWPSLRWDLASLLQAGGGLFGAGFYYKTFMWPSWRTYEPMIRSLAGLGPAPQACTLAAVSVEHLSCDVLIAGGGPAGLVAARTAARAGARVVLCEREPVVGGELEFEDGTIEERAGMEWAEATLRELSSRGVRLLLDTTVVGGSNGQVIAHAEPGGLAGSNTIYRIRPGSFVVAMGAVERPFAFVDNDRPGVMLLGAAERYLARYGVRVGQETVICANHNRAYAAAARLQAGGLHIRAVVDTREDSASHSPETAKLRDRLIRSGVECLSGHVVTAAKGSPTVTGAEVMALSGKAIALSGAGSRRAIPCDTILMSGGWTPATHATLQEGGTGRYMEDIAAFVATDQPHWRLSVGAANGTFELDRVCAEAAAAGLQAARSAGKAAGADPVPSARGDVGPQVVPFWRAPASRKDEKRQFVDFQNDVTVADLRTALEEGFSDIEHAKRYTALGFGTDQGRLSGVLGAAIIAELRGRPIQDVGVSRLRQPYHPVTMRSLAGLRVGAALRVRRCTPLHEWHVAHGGVLEATGLWMRPRYYVDSGADVFQAAQTEAKRVRAHGGIADASTLGKIDIAGPDAAAFLDYVYMTKASSVRVGRSRYAVSLREDGMVQDDGLLLRLAPDHFRVTTSTGHAEHMLSHIEYYRAAVWGDRALTITDVSDAWATIAVAGPQSRAALNAVMDPGSHAALAALQHMDLATPRIAATPVIVLRATFSGELGYEIHCPSGVAGSIWEALIGCGMPPYGLEALDILRLEKGYLTHSEMTGRTTPYDLGMQGLLGRSDDFIGRDLLDRAALHEPHRPRLIGLRAGDGRSPFLGGAQLVTPGDRTHPRGYVTSSAFSPMLGEWIGLALLARSIPEGETLIARDPLRSGDTPVRVTPAVHFDPAGQRMRA